MAECRVLRDGCAVPTRALGGVVREWVDRWDRDHPDLIGGRSRNGRRIGGGDLRRNERGHLEGSGGPSGAVTILHERTRQAGARRKPTGEVELGRGVSKRQLREMLSDRPRSAYTELRTADLIVAAVQRPDVFHDGTLPIVPNPSASSEARSSCCSGSLTGTVQPA